MKYDIFISYRRKGAGEKAEHLKDLLEPRYKKRISFDRENLTGLFAPKLIKRIDNCKDFILVLAQDSFKYKEADFAKEEIELYTYLATCSQEAFEQKINKLGPNANLDFVRIEVARALQRKDLNIIPIVPQSSDNFKFSSLNLPPDIVGIKNYEAIFYSDNADALFKDVIPKLKPHLKSRPDIPMKNLVYAASILALILLIAFGIYSYRQYQAEREADALAKQEAAEKERLMAQVDSCIKAQEIDRVLNQELNFPDDISNAKLKAINNILKNMILVEGGTFMQGAAKNEQGTYDDEVCQELETPQQEKTVETFFMGQYEVSIGEWGAIMEREYAADSCMYPITNITYEECEQFTDSLFNLTGLRFSIPRESEWEYAARGGVHQENTTFAGSSQASEVGWYADNSQGKPHICDAREYSIGPNTLDLFNMSGNVSEWCDTPFAPYDPTVINIDPTAKVIRGGNYDSPAYELAVYHRSPMPVTGRDSNTGLRIIIKKQ